MSQQPREDVVLTREMGCTEADLARWLPGATRHAPLESRPRGAGQCHVVTLENGRVEILATPAPPRRIAGIVLPVLQVSFRFVDLDACQREAFLNYFDRYTRRGGG